jgi:glycosyltransferase involved in cell wall biosynthesis
VAVVAIAYDLIPMRSPHFWPDQPWLATASGVASSGGRHHRHLGIDQRDYVELMGADPARVHVVYPGADGRFGPTVDLATRDRVLARYGLRRPYLLYVGSLGPHKNVQTLVRVFRRLKHDHQLPHQLVLCGRAAWGREVVEAAQDLVAAGDCRVVDFIPAADVPCLYHGAEAFGFLSLYEGFGLPPLEAMACGIPVVVSNTGSLPEVVGEAALQGSPTDEPAIQGALYRVLTDPDLRRDLRARGLRQAARFSWTETARQTLKVFETVLGAR